MSSRTKRGFGSAIWLIASACAALSAVICFYLPVYYQAGLFLAITMIFARMCESYGILHPVAWFGPFFLAYSVSFPIYATASGLRLDEIEIVIPLSILTYVAFVLPSLLIAPYKTALPAIRNRDALLRPICWIIAFACYALVAYVWSLGISTKREFVDATRASGTGFLFTVFSFGAIVFGLRCASYLSVRGKTVREYLFTGPALALILAFFLGYGVTGERDFIFRPVLFVLLVYYATAASWKYRSYILFGAVGALIIILPITQSAKSFLLTGSVNVSGFGFEDYWRNEFASSGRNLHYLVLRDFNGFNGETLIWDLKRYFGFIFTNQESPGMWFNNHVRELFGDEGTSGWGFSLMAEGYMNFGLVGPLVFFFPLGVITAFLYRQTSRSDIWFIFFLAYVPVMVYVLRADLANYFSLAFKVNLVMVLFIYFVRRFGAMRR